MKVLIAEDDLTSRTILEGIFKKWGYLPVMTSDGRAAWEVMQKPDTPSLVVLDRHMPGMDGLEVCRRIRRMNVPNPPYIIILTVKGEKSDIVEGLEAGANDYISKPYDNEELRARIKVGRRMVELQSGLNDALGALAQEAMHDPLTSIFNRRTILDTLKKEFARAKREGGTLSIGMCDIDYFKMVNDTYGHQVGDEVLCAFVQCIRDNLREYDHIGRYGGEEFLIVAPGSQGIKQEGLYGRLCRGVARKEIITKAGPISIRVSIGVAGAAGAGTADAMLAEADAALYRAKNNGRNRVAYAEQNLQEDEST